MNSKLLSQCKEQAIYKALNIFYLFLRLVFFTVAVALFIANSWSMNIIVCYVERYAVAALGLHA